MQVRPWKDGFRDIFSKELVGGKPIGEIYELFDVKSFEEFKDELSDVAWGFGRILGGLVNKPYVRVLGDGIHFRKAADRVNEYGCMRSKRFLVNGECPNKK